MKKVLLFAMLLLPLSLLFPCPVVAMKTMGKKERKFFYKPATMIAIAEKRNLTYGSDGIYRDENRRMYENDQDCDSCVIVKTWDFILERNDTIVYK